MVMVKGVDNIVLVLRCLYRGGTCLDEYLLVLGCLDKGGTCLSDHFLKVQTKGNKGMMARKERSLVMSKEEGDCLSGRKGW